MRGGHKAAQIGSRSGWNIWVAMERTQSHQGTVGRHGLAFATTFASLFERLFGLMIATFHGRLRLGGL